MSGTISNIDITGPVAVRTGQHADSETIGLFFTDKEATATRPFLQLFGSDADLLRFAESIVDALAAHRSITSPRPTGEPS